MICGMLGENLSQNLPHGMEGTSRKIILAFSDASCKDKVVTEIDLWKLPRKTRFASSLSSSAIAASIRIEPESAAGASRRVSRGASLGETTSAGAVNSQRTLHAAKATDDDGIPTLRRQRVGFIPRLCLTPSDSGIGFKYLRK